MIKNAYSRKKKPKEKITKKNILFFTFIDVHWSIKLSFSPFNIDLRLWKDVSKRPAVIFVAKKMGFNEELNNKYKHKNMIFNTFPTVPLSYLFFKISLVAIAYLRLLKAFLEESHLKCTKNNIFSQFNCLKCAAKRKTKILVYLLLNLSCVKLDRIRWNSLQVWLPTDFQNK